MRTDAGLTEREYEAYQTLLRGIGDRCSAGSSYATNNGGRWCDANATTEISAIYVLVGLPLRQHVKTIGENNYSISQRLAP
jgi:hypothetical protein